METFYVLRRNDGYVFIQRYVPQNYTTSDGQSVSFEKILETTDKGKACVVALGKCLEEGQIAKQIKKSKTIRQFIQGE